MMATLERVHYMAAMPDRFDLYTDHSNLVFIFDSLSIVSDLGKTSARKVLRWAVRLSVYKYKCVHTSGSENVWADLLGRWSALTTTRWLVTIPELPSASRDDFQWPSVSVIELEQNEHKEIRPKKL